MWFRLQIAMLAVLLLPPAAAAGQSGTRLRGTVSTTGTGGERTNLSQVQVSLECDSSPAHDRTATTDDNGQFLFSDLQPGVCTVKVIDPQLEEAATTVNIVADREVGIDLTTGVREVQQNVTVTAEQAQVDTSSSDTAAQAISQKTLQSAPLISERFQDALPLLPGVVRGPDGLMNIKGARSGQSGTLVNSASAADPVTGEQAISLPLEAVASVKVLDNPFSAEYGQFAGGITEVETRSGTDQWKYLVTNFFPRLRVRAGHVRGLESITPRFTVAGPLIKHKVFVFQSFDYRFVRVPVNSLPALTVPAQTRAPGWRPPGR
jgi:TonB-dependent Receptor Plug Domain